MEEAKEVHKCLRTAAGIFSYVKVNHHLIWCQCCPTIHVYSLQWLSGKALGQEVSSSKSTFTMFLSLSRTHLLAIMLVNFKVFGKR